MRSDSSSTEMPFSSSIHSSVVGIDQPSCSSSLSPSEGVSSDVSSSAASASATGSPGASDGALLGRSSASAGASSARRLGLLGGRPPPRASSAGASVCLGGRLLRASGQGLLRRSLGGAGASPLTSPCSAICAELDRQPGDQRVQPAHQPGERRGDVPASWRVQHVARRQLGDRLDLRRSTAGRRPSCRP